MAHDVFVSHSSVDRVLADAIVHELETHGIDCWIAPRNILPGVNYGEAIVAAIQKVEVMVVVVSDDANRSGHVPREVERAAAHNVSPCSMKTLAAVRTGYGEGLIPRAADVTLKERRRLVLVPRELPLSEIHLENMLALSRMGAVIAPPVPAFYTRPETVEDIVTHIAARVLDQFGLELLGVPDGPNRNRPARLYP